MLTNRIIKGYILLQSGLHIGGSDAGIHIGGIDNPVIKNPLTGLPYIPGSSLKGKMRFLLEHSVIRNIKELIPKKMTIPVYHRFNNNTIPLVFGNIEHSKDTNFMPTRVIFRDSHIIGVIKEFNKESFTINDIHTNIEEIRELMGSDFVEAKTEVTIDRLSGTVGGGGPRQIERVSAGTVFAFEIILRSFENDNAEEHFKLLKKGLKLVENDALGGSGSRGSGKIKFFGLTENDHEFSLD
ncbi:MAG TPA: type III-A CRISPR-associated RAMP protein Csm3 [Candidatus Cloacimonadota bacterium]|nr:type III-A CRISPR-associated RAMP protein Csm3 [Candidatus Cloacimonadota bacterium]HPM03630.1 type III-A CRISPR-associated RAMP protein Csm3 [Candidatus Cloacimonadota bacterium]